MTRKKWIKIGKDYIVTGNPNGKDYDSITDLIREATLVQDQIYLYRWPCIV